MKKLWLLAILLLVALPARADDNLRVTISMAAGGQIIQFILSENDTRAFLQRWNSLPVIEEMVPLSDGNSYGGLLLRKDNDDSTQEIRLFGGVGRQGEKSRQDDLRVLERWVLSKAPPPLGPALLAALDREVQNEAQTRGVAAPTRPSFSQQVILDCRTRARRNDRLRALCLEEALKQNVDMRGYANALEGIANQQLPSAPSQPLITR